MKMLILLIMSLFLACVPEVASADMMKITATVVDCDVGPGHIDITIYAQAVVILPYTPGLIHYLKATMPQTEERIFTQTAITRGTLFALKYPLNSCLGNSHEQTAIPDEIADEGTLFAFKWPTACTQQSRQ